MYAKTLVLELGNNPGSKVALKTKVKIILTLRFACSFEQFKCVTYCQIVKGTQ